MQNSRTSHALTTADTIVSRLESLADPDAVAGMARFGITGAKVYGIKIPVLRTLAKEIGRSHELALTLWRVNSRETRILAAMIDDHKLIDEAQMEEWVAGFDSWEVCDQAIMCDFEKTPFAWDKAVEWSGRKAEFEKRAGFVLMARLAGSDRKAHDSVFEPFFAIIRREAADPRNFVKKAVNWALRGIGKRNLRLYPRALALAEELRDSGNKVARWIGADAYRELTEEKTIARIKP